MGLFSEAAKWRLAAIGVLVPLAAVAAILIWQDYDSRRDSLVTNLELKSAQINAQLEDFVNTTEGVTAQLATNVSTLFPGVQQSDDTSAFLASFLESNPSYSRALIADRSGTILAASDAAAVGTRVPAQRFFDSVVGSNGYVVSDVFVPPNGGDPNTMFAQPIDDGSGIVSSYLLVKTELSTITAMLDMSVGFPTSAKSGIFDSQGVVLAGTGYTAPHPGMAAGKNISGSAVWAQAETTPTEAWYGPGLDKIDRIIFFDYPDKTPWITTVAFAQSELFDPLWDRVYAYSVALALTVVGTLIVTELLRRREGRAWRQAATERQTLRSVIDGSTDGILVVNSREQIEHANARMKETLGLTKPIQKGTPASSLLVELDSKGILDRDNAETLESLLRQGREPRLGTISTSAELELEVSAYPIRKPSGAITGQTLVVHDVTEEARLQRMKSEFVAHASHQLRTPLASILASSELLLGPDSEPQKRTKWLSLINSQALRMRSTISTLLNLSQLESGRITLDCTTVDLDSIATSIAKELGTHSPDHSFAIEIDEDSRHAICDRSKIVEVLQNLVDNAIKYSPDGGAITISASRHSDDFVAVSITDEGVGISEEDLATLFNPYERASATSRGLPGGTGLGLYVVRSLIELHGGSVWVDSREGQGSAFTFTLQAHRPGTEPAESGAAEREIHTRPTEKDVIPATGFAIRSVSADFRGRGTTGLA